MTLEDRGKPGRPPNTQPKPTAQPKPKAQGPPRVRKDNLKQNPDHDTEVDNNTDFN